MYSQYILKHYHKYPLMRTQDFVKLIYQSEYGAHFGIPFEFSYNFLLKECAKIVPSSQELTTEISPNLYRVNLAPYLYEGLDLAILANMFVCSSLSETATQENLFAKLDEFVQLCFEKKINLHPYSVKAAVVKYKQHPEAVSHTFCYKKNYFPAYRLVRKDLWYMYECISKVEELCGRGNVIFCIEGGSASGKSHYGKLLKEYFGNRCNLFSTDDFFLPKQRKSAERLAEIGGNVDYEALEELIKQLRHGELVRYNKFCCQTQTYQQVEEMPKQINIIEGVYSARKNLIKYYDFVMLFTVDDKTQQERILARNGAQILRRYNEEWLPLEKRYLKSLDTSSNLMLTYDFSALNAEE